MKILFTIRCINNCGGSERCTVSVANALVKKGHEVGIISYTGEGIRPFFALDERIQCHYLARRDKNIFPIRDIRRIHKLKEIYHREQPDVIVLIGTMLSFVNIIAGREHNIVANEYLSVHHLGGLFAPLMRKLAAKHAKCVVTLTEHDAEIYRKRYKAKYATPIANSLTLVNPERSTLKNPIVLGLGRLTKIKGFDLLIEAWAKVQHKDWTLRIVGSGKQGKYLKNKAKSLGVNNIEFVPATTNVTPHYQKASIFVLPSRSEGFGIVLTEAMSCGLPIVSFNSGAGPCEVIDDQKTGIIVPAQDTIAMAEAIDKLIAHPSLRQQMGEAAIKKAQQYAEEPIIAQWEAVFYEAIK